MKFVTLQSHQGKCMQEANSSPWDFWGALGGHQPKAEIHFLPSSMVEELGPYTAAFLTGPSVTAGEHQLELHLGWVRCWGHQDSLELRKELGTIVSYAREPCILSTELLQTLQSLGTKRVQERSAEDVILEGEFFPTCLPLSECQAGGGRALRPLGCWSHCWNEAGRWL